MRALQQPGWLIVRLPRPIGVGVGIVIGIVSMLSVLTRFLVKGIPTLAGRYILFHGERHPRRGLPSTGGVSPAPAKTSDIAFGGHSIPPRFLSARGQSQMTVPGPV